jgi:hypothetical protein
VSWATGPKAASANQKKLLTKGRKIKRAGNAQRKHKFHPHSALAVFLLRPFLRAQVSALQERHYRENTDESKKHSTQTACIFTHDRFAQASVLPGARNVFFTKLEHFKPN